MKRIFTLFSLLLTCAVGSSYAQNIQITDGMGNVLNGSTVTIGGTQGEYELIAEHYYVHNIGSTSINIKCKRQEITVVDGSTAALCWMVCSAYYGKGVYPTLLAPGGAYTSPAGDSVDLFKLHYQPNNNAGPSTYKVIFFNSADAADTAVLYVRFDVATGIKEVSKNMSLTAYPNPASDIVNFDASNVSPTATLRIVDVLGTVVKTVQFNNSNLKVSTADLKEGIYFYSVMDNNKAVMTRRLVISRQ